jgi:hypothetical protein
LAIGGTAREKNERLAKQCCDKQAVGIDPTCADPRGRMQYGAIRYAFK